MHVGRYHDSVKAGERELRQLIERERRRCNRATQLVLVGYSQGAQVSGDVYSDLRGKLRDTIAGVVLFGDPRYRRSSYAAQAKRRHNGILRARDEFPRAGRGRVLSYCHGRDLICQTYGTPGPHGTYASAGDAQQAAAKIAARIRLAHAPAFEMSVHGERYRVGALHVNFNWNPMPRSMTLAGSDDAFGGADHCTIDRREGFVSARWNRLGLSGVYITYGAYAHPDGSYDPHGNGCKYPGQIQVDSLVARGSYWHTAGGLGIGDPQSRIGHLYPHATHHPDGWWLASKTLPWDVNTPVGSLIATTRGGRVASLKMSIGAEGD